jgi:hypothetical protein
MQKLANVSGLNIFLIRRLDVTTSSLAKSMVFLISHIDFVCGNALRRIGSCLRYLMLDAKLAVGWSVALLVCCSTTAR